MSENVPILYITNSGRGPEGIMKTQINQWNAGTKLENGMKIDNNDPIHSVNEVYYFFIFFFIFYIFCFKILIQNIKQL